MTKNQKLMLGVGVAVLAIYLYKKNEAKNLAANKVVVGTETTSSAVGSLRGTSYEGSVGCSHPQYGNYNTATASQCTEAGGEVVHKR